MRVVVDHEESMVGDGAAFISFMDPWCFLLRCTDREKRVFVAGQHQSGPISHSNLVP